jgi:hypothetical protein
MVKSCTHRRSALLGRKKATKEKKETFFYDWLFFLGGTMTSFPYS